MYHTGLGAMATPHLTSNADRKILDFNAPLLTALDSPRNSPVTHDTLVLCFDPP